MRTPSGGADAGLGGGQAGRYLIRKADGFAEAGDARSASALYGAALRAVPPRGQRATGSRCRPVRTPSAEQVRQPIYDRSVGHWRNYAQYLDELITVIEPIRDRYRRYEPAGTA